jgi:hypothetical protein
MAKDPLPRLRAHRFPFLKTKQNLVLAGAPRPLGDVVSFGDDVPMGIRIC